MRSISFVVVIVAGVLTPIVTSSVQAAEWKVGVSRAVITPSSPTWLSGYSNRDHVAEGRVHELNAKALAIESEAGVRVVIVTCDLGSIYAELTSAVREASFLEYGLLRESLIINVSHTHCAPEIAAERAIMHGMPDVENLKLVRYINEELQPKLITLVGNAISDLRPARLHLSQSTANFSSNRRLVTEDGVIGQQNPKGVVDHQVPVLQVSDPDGTLRAVMFGYACHNTTLDFYQYCGDYAGFAQEQIERMHPGAIALFVAGCGGDQNPYPRHGPHGLEYCRSHGFELSDAVEMALGGRQTDVHGPLRVATETIKLKLEPLPSTDQLKQSALGPPSIPQRKAVYLLNKLKEQGEIDLEQDCQLSAVRFGDELLFLAFSGETVLDYSIRAKSEFAGPFVWAAGYCNDVYAYLPSLRVLKEGGYEGRLSIAHQLMPTPFTESVEQDVMNAMRGLVKNVSN